MTSLGHLRFARQHWLDMTHSALAEAVDTRLSNVEEIWKQRTSGLRTLAYEALTEEGA